MTADIPDIATLFKGNIYDDELSISDKFRTSNDLCPVIDYELSSGSGQYDFVDDGMVDDFGDRMFSITLNEATDNEVGLWPFQITAIAEGSETDASGTGTLVLDGQMEVQKICISLPVDGFNAVFEVSLPMEGTEEESFPAGGSAEYAVVHEPTDGCIQSFDYRMSNAGGKPEELTIDSETGVFTMVKDYESKSIFEIDLIIDTTGGVEDD